MTTIVFLVYNRARKTLNNLVIPSLVPCRGEMLMTSGWRDNAAVMNLSMNLSTLFCCHSNFIFKHCHVMPDLLCVLESNWATLEQWVQLRCTHCSRRVCSDMLSTLVKWHTNIRAAFQLVLFLLTTDLRKDRMVLTQGWYGNSGNVWLCTFSMSVE